MRMSARSSNSAARRCGAVVNPGGGVAPPGAPGASSSGGGAVVDCGGAMRVPPAAVAAGRVPRRARDCTRPRAHPSAGGRRLQGRSVLRHHLVVGPGGLGAYLLDAVAQLAAEDELGVACPALQLAVEGQLAVLVQLHQAQLAQLLDEAAE